MNRYGVALVVTIGCLIGQYIKYPDGVLWWIIAAGLVRAALVLVVIAAFWFFFRQVYSLFKQ